MSPQSERQSRARNRVSNACQRCRKQKIKCSGTVPCQTCDNRGVHCEPSSDVKKIAIPESVLRDLRNRLDELENQHRLRKENWQPAQDALTESQADDVTQSDENGEVLTRSAQHQAEMPQASPDSGSESDNETTLMVEKTASHSTGLSNPLVPEKPAYVPISGRLRYLGHSSTWSFTQQVFRMINQSPHSMRSAGPSMNVEGEAQDLDATNLIIAPADRNGLPSLELSLFYVQTVKFRTHPLYYLFDESDFVSNLHHLYEGLENFVQANRLWYVHYLLIMAFGKAFTLQAQSSGGIAGIELFNRALRLLPDVTFLCRDPVMATEVLCCIALYLQSIDHRCAGLIYIGQALRMAQSHGLHTDMQASSVGVDLVNRGRRIWWTVYTLDRKISSSMGLPNSLHDRDVTAPSAPVIITDATSLGQPIHVKICQLLGRIINTVYSIDGTLNRTFLTTAQEVLRGIGGLADELAAFSNRCFGEISRVVAHLELAYHQCIILASRPFLFHLLKVRLESSDLSRTFPLSSSMKGLVQACVDSAVQIATTVARLRQHELLDLFLPFDLEIAFSAALVLVIASVIHPKLLPREDWVDTILSVFDYMTMKGNILASFRKGEIEELAHIRYNLGCDHRRRNECSLTNNASVPEVAHISPATGSLPSLGDPFFDEWIVDDGLSGTQIMDLADALDPQALCDLIRFQP